MNNTSTFFLSFRLQNTFKYKFDGGSTKILKKKNQFITYTAF